MYQYLVAGAMMGMQIKQQREQAEAQNELYEQNADNAIKGKAFTDQRINTRLNQELVVAGQQKRKALVEAISAQSTMKARGKETAGTSINRLYQSVNNKLGEYLEDITFNIEGALDNAAAEKKAGEFSTQSRINSVPRSEFRGDMALIEGGLKIASMYEADQAREKKAQADPYDWAFSEG